MDPDRGGGSLEGRHALREEAGDESGQHVASTGRGEPGRGIGVDRRAAVRRSDHGIGALVDDDGAGKLNARIVFRTSKADTFRIIVTTCDPDQDGAYRLRIYQAENKKENKDNKG